MKIRYFCPHWGSEQLAFDTFLQRIVDTGYDGVEMSVPIDDGEREKIVELINRHGLQFIAQHWETTDANFDEHKKNYLQRLRNLVKAKPLFINSQTGKDYFTEAQNIELMNAATDISTQSGITIIHETHRGKWSFAAHITRQYLQKYPSIRLAFDVSHWCNVAESFLQDQEEALELAIIHADHIHARVGHTQAPQVTDPRAPEWQEALQIHITWWDKIIRLKKAQGASTFTITPEFGAPPYLPLLPYTQQPIVSQWDINKFMFLLLKERYEHLLSV